MPDVSPQSRQDISADKVMTRPTFLIIALFQPSLMFIYMVWSHRDIIVHSSCCIGVELLCSAVLGKLEIVGQTATICKQDV